MEILSASLFEFEEVKQTKQDTKKDNLSYTTEYSSKYCRIYKPTTSKVSFVEITRDQRKFLIELLSELIEDQMSLQKSHITMRETKHKRATWRRYLKGLRNKLNEYNTNTFRLFEPTEIQLDNINRFLNNNNMKQIIWGYDIKNEIKKVQ
jgi:hypothetical protein